MSKRGDGIRTRADGTQEIRISMGLDPATGKYRRTSYYVHGTRTEAAKVRRELLRHMDEGRLVAPTSQTLAAYLEDWMRSCASKGLSPSTLTGYESIVRLYLAPALGRVPLQKLTPPMIEKVYADLQEDDARGPSRSAVSAQTALHAHRVLHAALKRAVRLQMLPRNPCESVEAPRPKRAQTSALDEAGVARMLQSLRASSDQTLYVAVMLAVYTGMRRGELLALRWSDVDLDAGTLTVARSVVIAQDRSLTFKAPKSGRIRVLTLPGRAVADLKEHRVRQSAGRLAMGPGYHDESLILANADGSPVHPEALSGKWQKARRKHAIPVRFHDLRHTHATLLLKGGESLRVVADRLGHSSPTLTLSTYAHVLPGQDAAAAERLDVMLALAEKSA
jgi:integrase